MKLGLDTHQQDSLQKQDLGTHQQDSLQKQDLGTHQQDSLQKQDLGTHQHGYLELGLVPSSIVHTRLLLYWVPMCSFNNSLSY